jgi:hypothetical protein
LNILKCVNPCVHLIAKRVVFWSVVMKHSHVSFLFSIMIKSEKTHLWESIIIGQVLGHELKSPDANFHVY